MKTKNTINRRDFLNGVALSVAAGGSLSPLELLAKMRGVDVYPPALTGMRGSHAGSFEVAHAVAWAGTQFARPRKQADGTYDLVVVGGGISGLAAAFFYRQRAGKGARILVLDNHDDFGGHAKRNEFEVDGKKLICYGGSQTIDTPGHYSGAASRLLKDVGIDTERFYDYYDQEYFSKRHLGRGLYFSKGEYGQDVTAPDAIRGFFAEGTDNIDQAVDLYPISAGSKYALKRLLSARSNYLSDLGRDERIALLRRISYTVFLREYAGIPKEVTDMFRDSIRGFWGVGWDSLSALEGYRLGMPGTLYLEIGELENEPPGRDEPYIFHFPDGNAGVARALVRQLIPRSLPGRSMEDLVLARADYDLLDRKSSKVRIRLNSTAVDVRHADDRKTVDVTYVQNGETFRVRGKHAVMACYNNIVPHICPEVPEAQREAIAFASKVPLVYISIALRNWQAFAKLGYNSITIPKPDLMHSFVMDFPVSMGGYNYTQNPDEPSVIHGTYVPAFPDEGLSSREQHRRGRRLLYEMSYDEFERRIVNQMSGALAPGGFDPDRDIAAITVNRWPHGYAYEYNELSDPPGMSRKDGPHIAGRARIGRISIANSDAEAYAYVNGAIDAADRAVNEQLAAS
ncbi:MAG: NAD(P)-binding protein [Gammaproteobacteria bacterium]|nr:NAD(P)-binding protein [Gammaproteobacteria bacterium]